MNVKQFIEQIENQSGDVFKMVSGVASLENLPDITNPVSLPAAFVVPMDFEATENTTKSGLNQLVWWTVAIIVVLDNTTDRQGLAMSEVAVEDCFWALNKALLNWIPDPKRNPQSLQLSRGRLTDMDASRAYWQFNFTYGVYVSHRDGYIPPAQPLQRITIQTGNGGPTAQV